jgi:hypothetical protein
MAAETTDTNEVGLNECMVALTAIAIPGTTRTIEKY